MLSLTVISMGIYNLFDPRFVVFIISSLVGVLIYVPIHVFISRKMGQKFKPLDRQMQSVTGSLILPAFLIVFLCTTIILRNAYDWVDPYAIVYPLTYIFLGLIVFVGSYAQVIILKKTGVYNDEVLTDGKGFEKRQFSQ
ncbi:MAG: hypothetical protein ABJ275_08410 [Maricaulaceae bacterium]